MQDTIYLQQALQLAKTRQGFCAPNPSVGAVIVREGNILATGFHFAAGAPHAEIEALNHCSDPKNATIYVTLEPCCHHGKTPPCTDALIQAKVKRVVYGYRDPNVLVSGKGHQQLQEAGITCEYIAVPDIAEFYASYRYWQQTKLPFITAKLAMTLDGKIAGKEGKPIAITGKMINQFTHQQRKQSDAILTTVKTILHDDPQLNSRLADEIIAKPVYILDQRLQLSKTARIFSTAKTITIFHGKQASVKNRLDLEAMGARCISIDTIDATENHHQLDLYEVIKNIGHDGVHDLWVEAGGKCFNSIINMTVAKKAYIYISPWVATEGQAIVLEKFFKTPTSVNWKQFGQDVMCEICW